MAQASLKQIASPYYPPRARWYSPVFYPCLAVRRLLHLEKLRLPQQFASLQFAVSVLVPGFAFLASGRRWLGRSFLAAYCLAALTFLIALGYPAGNVGFALMISAHASSLVYLQGYWLRD